MKNRGSWILFLVVVVLSLYAYFGEYQGKEKETVSKEQKAIILKDFKPDQINSIEIDNLEAKISLSRSTDGWGLSSPVVDSADNAEIESWVKQLAEEKSLSIAVEGSDIQWKYFGFDKPVKSIKVKTSSNQEVTIEVSEKKNFEGNAFIRFPGQNQVLVAGPSWSGHAGKTVIELRNKRIFRHQISNVQSIKIKNKKASVEIENKDAKWISPLQTGWLLDQNGVRDLITKISEIKSIEFTAEKDKLAATKKKLNLAEPIASVDVKLAEGAWSAKFFQTKDKAVYAEIPTTQLLVKVNPDIFDRVNEISLLDLRDYKLPFAAFNKLNIDKFSYETSLKKATLIKKGTEWKLDPEDSVNEVQQEKVGMLLDVIKNLAAKQYLTKSEVKKDFGKQKIVFKDATDKVYFELQFSDSEKRKVKKDEISVRIAKTNLHDETFLMDETEFEKLSLNDIIKIKVSNEGKSLPVDAKKEDKNVK